MGNQTATVIATIALIISVLSVGFGLYEMNKFNNIEPTDLTQINTELKQLSANDKTLNGVIVNMKVDISSLQSNSNIDLSNLEDDVSNTQDNIKDVETCAKRYIDGDNADDIDEFMDCLKSRL